MRLSPLTRGTRPPEGVQGDPAGIIPAYAGNTRTSRSPSPCAPDHPRLRGEHLMTHLALSMASGSSPLTRGTHHLLVAGNDGAGIIPAYAGNTTRLGSTLGLNGDHPRLRGEHAVPERRYHQVGGSSPLTRGTRSSVNMDSKSLRIIPAYAGNTQNAIQSQLAKWDHPRLRGEHQ